MRSLLCSLVVVQCLVVVGAATLPATARAQDDSDDSDDDYPTDRPSSGDMSLFSGRTMGNGEAALAAGLGWPSIWAGIWLSPSSVLDFGIRGHVYYGSPVESLTTGAGGGLTIPVRIHLFGKDTFDLAIRLEPELVLGEGRLVGQDAVAGGYFGLGVVVLGGFLAGAQVSDRVTLSFGIAGEGGFLTSPAAGATASSGFGGLVGQLGLEALMARDTMLFVHVEGGIGFAAEVLFPDGQEILRASLGFAYLL